MKRRVCLVMVAGLAASLCAFGDSTQWEIGYPTTPGSPSAGTYNYAGGSAPLIGSNIELENVQGNSTPDNSGTLGELNVVGGLLNFTSGAFVGTPFDWTWGSTLGDPGTLSIKGCVSAEGSFAGLGMITGSGPTATCSNAQTLVSDEFTTVGVVNVLGLPEMQFGNLQGSINPLIAAYFGVNPAFTSPASSMMDAVAGLPLVPGTPFGTGTPFTVTPAPPGGTLSLVPAVSEGWSLSSTVGVFGLGLVVLGVMRRVRLIAF